MLVSADAKLKRYPLHHNIPKINDNEKKGLKVANEQQDNGTGNPINQA